MLLSDLTPIKYIWDVIAREVRRRDHRIARQLEVMEQNRTASEVASIRSLVRLPFIMIRVNVCSTRGERDEYKNALFTVSIRGTGAEPFKHAEPLFSSFKNPSFISP